MASEEEYEEEIVEEEVRYKFNTFQCIFYHLFTLIH